MYTTYVLERITRGHALNSILICSWTGRTAISDFISASQKGMDNGAFIMHRIHGSSVDITPDATRAVVKMKASITQRFNLPPQGYVALFQRTMVIPFDRILLHVLGSKSTPSRTVVSACSSIVMRQRTTNGKSNTFDISTKRIN